MINEDAEEKTGWIGGEGGLGERGGSKASVLRMCCWHDWKEFMTPRAAVLAIHLEEFGAREDDTTHHMEVSNE